MPPPKIRVFATPAIVAEAAAQHIAESAESALRDTGSFAIALSGGNTPRMLYQLLADEPYVSRIDWSKVEIFFGDERCVPPEDRESNFHRASETLLDLVPIPPANIHRIRGEIDPQAAAIEYGQLLKQRFADGGLDFALLGMGEDGHTASLFPGSAALAETNHRCVANFVDNLNAWRITMTVPFLNRSKQILMLVTGSAKAERVQQALEPTDAAEPLPVQLINPSSGHLTWFLDAAAACME
ncbi:MAG: 6-phosphogluconolactonase [Planctomycetota bacterium]|nr:6-phosphogluconolactonase [Planctomycetota bacterium]